jgi:hypothetical protein
MAYTPVRVNVLGRKQAAPDLRNLSVREQDAVTLNETSRRFWCRATCYDAGCVKTSEARKWILRFQQFSLN